MTNRTNEQNIPDRTLIVVLGMHRSGTSAVTRAMETMGAELGARLMPGVIGNNDKGFFEDVDINAINIEVMTAAGADWQTMAPINLDEIDAEHFDQFRAKATAVLRGKCEGKTFVLKDPRIARLLPFWQPIFARLDIRAAYVVAVRNPISVANSLTQRDQLAEEKSYLLWLAHLVPALKYTHDSLRAFVDYDRLMDAPRQTLTQIASRLGLSLNTQAIVDFEKDFLDSKLRHTRFASTDLTLVQSAPRQVKALFAALDTNISTGDPIHFPALVESIEDAEQYLEDVAPLLRYEWRTEQHIRQLNGKLDESSRIVSELNRIIHESNRAIAEKNQILHELNDQISSDKREIARLGEINGAQQVELCRSEEAVKKILDSASWRLTGPLRAAKKVLTRRKFD